MAPPLTKIVQLCLMAAVLALAVLVAAPGMTPGNTTGSSTLCPTSHRCGGALDVRYPFWVAGGNGATGAVCGYPSLRLECRRGTSVLRLPSGEYGVTAVDYGDRSFTVFDLAATTSASCPNVAGRNLSLPAGPEPPLSLLTRDRNITFMLNCTFTGLASDHRVACLQHGQLRSFVFRSLAYFPYHQARLCQQVVGMPVEDAAANDLVAALRTGFKLGWSAPAAGGDCAACEQAGGLCGQRGEVFTCIKPTTPASPASKSPGGGTQPTEEDEHDGPFLTTRGIVAFSLIGIILVSGGIAICLVHFGPGAAARRAQGQWED